MLVPLSYKQHCSKATFATTLPCAKSVATTKIVF